MLGGRCVQGLGGRDLARTANDYQCSLYFLVKGWKV